MRTQIGLTCPFNRAFNGKLSGGEISPRVSRQATQPQRMESQLNAVSSGMKLRRVPYSGSCPEQIRERRPIGRTCPFNAAVNSEVSVHRILPEYEGKTTHSQWVVHSSTTPNYPRLIRGKMKLTLTSDPTQDKPRISHKAGECRWRPTQSVRGQTLPKTYATNLYCGHTEAPEQTSNYVRATESSSRQV